MKVLHLINSLARGGAERLVSDLLPSLGRRGVECSLVALDERGDAFSGSLRAAGIPVSFVRPGEANPYSPARFADVRRAIVRTGPDIVHAHLGPTFHWCALASIVERDPAFVATEHASANRRMGIPVIRGLERFIYSRYSRIACVSADAAAALRAWIGLDEAKIAVIPNGIHRGRVADGATIPAKDVVGFLRGRIGVAMTARLVPPKDHQTAMAALALLPKEYCLVLAGDGPDRQSLEERARSLGVADRCAFLGMRDDVPSVLAASSIYLQSSRVEGFGIAVLEAMAAGLPVAASEAPGLGNLVRGAGLLFPPGDAIACAAAIRRLREDGNLAESLIEKGGARAAEYSLERCAAAYEELYRAASAERGQGRRSPAPKKA